MSNLIHILEFTRVTQAREVDEDAGVLHDLVALGPSSENGRDYPESTMHAALPLFEGKQSFANHSRESSVYDVLGVWQECRVAEGKVRGNFHYFKSHPLAARLVEAARRPELNAALGFSINGRGRTTERGGRQIVESLEVISSIDCVAQPASCRSLYESRNPPVKKKLSELIESLKKRPRYVKALREMAEAGVMSPDAPMDAPPDEAPADDSGDHEQALMDAAKAVLDDDSLSTADKLKKIKQILKMVDGGGSPDGPAATEESRRLKADNARLLAEKVVRKAAHKAGVTLSEALVERGAAPGMSEAQADEYVNELKAFGGGGVGQKPRSAGPVQTSQGGSATVKESKDAIPADVKARAEWLKRGAN